MAAIQLADVIQTTAYLDLEPQLDPRLLALFNSGIIATDSLFDGVAQGPARTGELVFWRDLNMDDEPNHSSTEAVDAVPKKTKQSSLTVVKAFLNQGWSSYNLTRELQRGTDAMQHIRNRTATYWAIYRQRRLVAMLRGLVNSNLAGNFSGDSPGTASDMIVDVSIADATMATAANLFNALAFSDAVYTMGDRSSELGALIVHSAVHNTLQKLQLIEYVQDVDQRTAYETYRGRRLITDDSTPFYEATPGMPGLGFKYVSILIGQEAIGYGTGTATVPVEVESNAATGHGAGSQTLWERRAWLMHPFGFDNLDVVHTANEDQQNLTDLMDENNWERVVPRKSVPLAFIITNG